jgi:hypothetical protein
MTFRLPNKVTGANSRPALQFESHGRYHGGAAVAQFYRWVRRHR